MPTHDINSRISLTDSAFVETYSIEHNQNKNKILSQLNLSQPVSKVDTGYSNSTNKSLEFENPFEQKISQRPILPILPYSPLSTPKVSPEHRLHPHVKQSLYHSSCESLQRDISSTSVTKDSNRITHLNQYQISQQLGQGSYGLVQLAYNREDSTYYAMKSLSKKKLLKSCGLFNRPPPMRKSASTTISAKSNKSAQSIVDPLQKIYKEIAFHKKLNHPNIVKLIEVLNDPSQEYLYMVFEHVEKGAVMQIGTDPPFPEKKAKRYFIDTLLGLEYLHYQKIIHRDIKPANLLLSKDDVIKISDFGVSNEFTGDDVYLSSSAGSPAFMAPESVQGGDHSFTGKALDIWALGVTLYTFLFGTVPYEHCNRYLLYQMIVNNPILYPKCPSISPEVQNLLQKMLDKNPLTRIKLAEIKFHTWITDNNLYPLPNEEENCGIKSIDVNEEEVANSIRFVPRLETVIRVKMILKQKSFINPLRFGSASKLNEMNPEINLLKDPKTLPQRSSCGAISPILENKLTMENQNQDKNYK